MVNRERIFDSVKYIEENIKSDISISEISGQFGYSFYYYSRLFKAIVGCSPKNYIMKRKITSSYFDLVNSDRKIIDIALDYGFNSPENYSRTFMNILGCNPSAVRSDKNRAKKGDLFCAFTKERYRQMEFLNQAEPELVSLERKYLVGLPFYYEMGKKDDLSNVWNLLEKNKNLINERATPEKYYQVQYWLPGQDPDSIFFFIAAEVKGRGNIPIQFTAKELPGQDYLRFLHKGLSNTVGHTYRYIYEKWLPETDYKLTDDFNFEYYGERYLGPFNPGSISEIYIPVKQ